MFKEVSIGEKKVPLKATASTIIRYRQVFKRDLLKSIGTNEDEVDAGIIQELAYVMAMAAAGEDMMKLNEETYMDWLDQFDSFDIINPDTAMEIIEVWNASKVTASEAKKKEG